MQALASPCEISQLARCSSTFENDPTSELSGRALKVDLKNADIFSFGEEGKSLVGSVDLVYRNLGMKYVHFISKVIPRC